MNFKNSHKDSLKLSKKAFEHIETSDLSPYPSIYELWYTHVAGLDPELDRALEILSESKQDVTNEICDELYERYLSAKSQNERVRSAGSRVSETIQAVGGVVSSVKAATAKYSQSLEHVTSKFADDSVDVAEARAVISEVVSNTQNMIAQNEKLETELLKSTEVMQDLQRDLDRVKKEAMTDGLTGLSNRKFLDAELELIWTKCQNDEASFSIAILDIDHFKSFNDSYGHQVGDQVLRLVAGTLLDGVKGRDIVARYGGEEFFIIFPGTEVTQAAQVVDQLRKAVAGKEVINRNTGDKLGRITLSAGVAQCRKNLPIDELVNKADKALYEAKHDGRNKVNVAV